MFKSCNPDVEMRLFEIILFKHQFFATPPYISDEAIEKLCYQLSDGSAAIKHEKDHKI